MSPQNGLLFASGHVYFLSTSFVFILMAPGVWWPLCIADCDLMSFICLFCSLKAKVFRMFFFQMRERVFCLFFKSENVYKVCIFIN